MALFTAHRLFGFATLLLVLVTTSYSMADDTAAPNRTRKIVLLAGKKSHGPDGNGQHDYAWSVRLLKLMLDHSNVSGKIRVEYYLDGWPKNQRTLEDADTIVVISDGRDGDKFSDALHLESEERIAFVDRLMKHGCGLVTFHFSTFAPQKDADHVLDWNGGYFQWETSGKRDWYSNITTLEAEVKPVAPDHPICRGLKPWTMKEEFYFDLRFRPEKDPITPILEVPALPAKHADGHIVAWARQRPDGGRGFGTTCGHYYDNWQHPGFRKLMLNAIAWTAHVEVPENGVESRYFDRDEIRKTLIAAAKKGAAE